MNCGLIFSLLIVGIVLLLLEIFVIPGVGISGILGIAALVFGCVSSFETFGRTVGLYITGGVLLVILVLLCYTLRAKTWKRLSLDTQVSSSAGQDSVSAVKDGDCGVTITRIAPMGTARINGRQLEVKSAEGFLDPGTEIEVAGIEENIIYVKTLKSNN